MSTEMIAKILDPNSNPISILNLATDYTAADVRRQYRKQTLLAHPDQHPDNPNANAAFNRLSEARDYLLYKKGEQVETIITNYYFIRENDSARTSLNTETSEKRFNSRAAPFEDMKEIVEGILYPDLLPSPISGPKGLEIVTTFIERFPDSIDKKEFFGSTLLFSIVYKLSRTSTNKQLYHNYFSLAKKLIDMGADPFIGSLADDSTAISRMVASNLWELLDHYTRKHNKNIHEIACEIIKKTKCTLVAKPILEHYREHDKTLAHDKTKEIIRLMTQNDSLIPLSVESGHLDKIEATQRLCKKIADNPNVYRELPVSYRAQAPFIVIILAQQEQKFPSDSFRIPVEELNPDLVHALVYLYPWLTDYYGFSAYKPLHNKLLEEIKTGFAFIVIGSLFIPFALMTPPITIAIAASCMTYACVLFTASTALYFCTIATAIVANYISFKCNPEASKIEEIKNQHGFFSENKSPVDAQNSLNHAEQLSV